MEDVTRLLQIIERGDSQAIDKLLPAVYEDLRKLAAHKLAQEPPGQTLQGTALVHEAYLRLVRAGLQTWQNRAHFFKAAAEAMRRILIENARRKKSLKRGGDRQQVELNDSLLMAETVFAPDDWLALDEALEKLAGQHRIKADLVKLRAFAGLTSKQAAEILDISEAKASEDLAYARAWLSLEIKRDGQD